MATKQSRMGGSYYLLNFRSKKQREETKKIAYNSGTDMKNLILDAVEAKFPSLKNLK